MTKARDLQLGKDAAISYVVNNFAVQKSEKNKHERNAAFSGWKATAYLEDRT